MEEERKDSEFMKGLEAMYLRVVAGEKPGGAPPPPEDLDCAYALLGLSKDTPLEEIKWAYATLTHEWSPERFPFNPKKREEAQAKLKEIRLAYEQILSAHGQEMEMPPESAPALREQPTPDLGKKRPPFYFRRMLFPLLAGGGLLVLGFLMWPTIFHYDAFQVDDKYYPLRINRLTGAISFFDGAKWGSLPLSLPSLPKPFGSGIPSPGGLLQGPAAPAISGPTPPAVQEPTSSPSSPSPPNAPSSSPAPKAERQGPAGNPPAKPSPAARATGDVGVAKTTAYAIQIGAMSELRGAEDLVDSAKKRGLESYYLEDDIGGRPGYRVFLGRFSTRGEALRFFEERKLKPIYGDSFVRKLPAALAAGKEGS